MICIHLKLYLYFYTCFIVPTAIRVLLFPFRYIHYSIYFFCSILYIIRFLFFHISIYFSFFILTFHIFIFSLKSINYFQSYFYLYLFHKTLSYSDCFDTLHFWSFHQFFVLLTSNYFHYTDLTLRFCMG